MDSGSLDRAHRKPQRKRLAEIRCRPKAAQLREIAKGRPRGAWQTSSEFKVRIPPLCFQVAGPEREEDAPGGDA